MNTIKIAEKFAKEPVKYVGRDTGTRYQDGSEDFQEYFETQDGKHIVVEHRHVGNKTWAQESDGVVW